MTELLTLALPTYNEEANIDRVVEDTVTALDALVTDWQLIIVDNASTDGTVARANDLAAAQPRVSIVRHQSNLQYSGSCATAMREAKGDIVAIMDSDGQMTAADLPRFVDQIHDGADLVFGWRRDRNDPIGRLASSKLFNLMGKVYLKYPYHDLNCGFRAFNRRFIEVAHIEHRINLVNPELYVRAVIGGLRIDEVPVRHFPRSGGATSHDFRRAAGLLRDVNAYLAALRSEMRAHAP